MRRRTKIFPCKKRGTSAPVSAARCCQRAVLARWKERRLSSRCRNAKELQLILRILGSMTAHHRFVCGKATEQSPAVGAQ